MNFKSLPRYKNSIAEYLQIPNKHVTLYWKGRVALYAILQAMDIKDGDEIILPGFTCVVVPNAIIYLGAKPIYVDVDANTFNIDVAKIEAKITPKTKAIIAQNTFGLSSDLDEIMKIAAKHNLKVVEDCTHGFGGFYKSKMNGTIADAAFYSTQWNKPFSTGIGGMAITNNKLLAEKLNAIEAKLQTPTLKDEFVLSAQIYVKSNFVNDFTYWFLIKLYRWLSAKNILTGSSQGEELQHPIMPQNFVKGMSKTQARKGVQALQVFSENLKLRKTNAKKYDEMLQELNIEIPLQPDYTEHTFIKYPVLVSDRKAFLAEAEKLKLEIGEWFLSPIHPIEKDFEQWHYALKSCTNAEFISQHIINLPTDKKLSSQKIEAYKTLISKFKMK